MNRPYSFARKERFMNRWLKFKRGSLLVETLLAIVVMSIALAIIIQVHCVEVGSRTGTGKVAVVETTRRNLLMRGYSEKAFWV